MKLPHEWSDAEVADLRKEVLARSRDAGHPVAASTVAEQVDLTAELVAGIRRALTADEPRAAALMAWALLGGAQTLYRTFAAEAAARAN